MNLRIVFIEETAGIAALCYGNDQTSHNVLRSEVQDKDVTEPSTSGYNY